MKGSSSKRIVAVKAKKKRTAGAFKPCFDLTAIEFFKLGAYKVTVQALIFPCVPV